ncbi:hypothetical protein J4438_03235 [Candidatus Woesearchaeota archaeon]|nr:hypothetical protein [Candidatus Woesearchaeota archaeon]
MSYNSRQIVFRYVIIFVFIVFVLYLLRSVQSIYAVGAVIALIVVGYLVYSNKKQPEFNFGKDVLVRYTLLCHSCNWEWMSNVTDKEHSRKCPNCGESSRTEVMGIRKVSRLPKQNNKELTSFFE